MTCAMAAFSASRAAQCKRGIIFDAFFFFNRETAALLQPRRQNRSEYSFAAAKRREGEYAENRCFADQNWYLKPTWISLAGRALYGLPKVSGELNTPEGVP